jgi:hypothetical protein
MIEPGSLRHACDTGMTPSEGGQPGTASERDFDDRLRGLDKGRAFRNQWAAG